MPLDIGRPRFDTQRSAISALGEGFGVAAASGIQSERDGMSSSIPSALGKTTTKKEIVDRIAAEMNQPRADVKRTIQAFLDEVIEELGRGNRLEFRDFGVFEIRERAARRAQNPKTLEQVEVPARKTVKFKTGRLMKVRVDGTEDDEG